MVHHHNAVGKKAQVVSLKAAPTVTPTTTPTPTPTPTPHAHPHADPDPGEGGLGHEREGLADATRSLGNDFTVIGKVRTDGLARSRATASSIFKLDGTQRRHPQDPRGPGGHDRSVATTAPASTRSPSSTAATSTVAPSRDTLTFRISRR